MCDEKTEMVEADVKIFDCLREVLSMKRFVFRLGVIALCT